MGQSFANSPSFLMTSESVTSGHPDKMCDQISDGILDEIIAQDPQARVACETCAGDNMIMVVGEITTTAKIDIEAIVRQTIKDIGYTNQDSGIDYTNCTVIVKIHQQSPDIAESVSNSLEARLDQSPDKALDSLGAGDQGMMVGYASNECQEFMPLSIALSHRLARKLETVRKNNVLEYLRPDGKSQVTIEYSRGVPKRIHTVVISTQHKSSVSNKQLKADIMHNVIKSSLPEELLDENTLYYINPSGRFVKGGPAADAGLTGRKIIVDTYGGIARHGGGAFSGKDSTKVDRTGAYGARYVAKNIVAAGLADQVEIQISYAIGMASPISLNLETFGTNHVNEQLIIELIKKHFDLRPGALINSLGLRKPIFKQTATYGHFGRLDLDLPWERLDKASILKAESGLESTSQASLRD